MFKIRQWIKGKQYFLSSILENLLLPGALYKYCQNVTIKAGEFPPVTILSTEAHTQNERFFCLMMNKYERKLICQTLQQMFLHSLVVPVQSTELAKAHVAERQCYQAWPAIPGRQYKLTREEQYFDCLAYKAALFNQVMQRHVHIFYLTNMALFMSI